MKFSDVMKRLACVNESNVVILDRNVQISIKRTNEMCYHIESRNGLWSILIDFKDDHIRGVFDQSFPATIEFNKDWVVPNTLPLDGWGRLVLILEAMVRVEDKSPSCSEEVAPSNNREESRGNLNVRSCNRNDKNFKDLTIEELFACIF